MLHLTHIKVEIDFPFLCSIKLNVFWKSIKIKCFKTFSGSKNSTFLNERLFWYRYSNFETSMSHNANSSWHFCLFEWTFFYLSLICKLEFAFFWIDSTFWLQKPWIDSRYKKTWTRVQVNIGKYRSYDADSCK